LFCILGKLPPDDAKGNVRSEIGHWMKRDARGTVFEGGSVSTVQGPASFHYTITDGQVVVDQNDFKVSPPAARAIALAKADIESFVGAPATASGGASTASVRPLDSLVEPPDPNLPSLVTPAECRAPVDSRNGPQSDSCINLLLNAVNQSGAATTACDIAACFGASFATANEPACAGAVNDLRQARDQVLPYGCYQCMGAPEVAQRQAIVNAENALDRERYCPSRP
jgi:hypothetical protein